MLTLHASGTTVPPPLSGPLARHGRGCRRHGDRAGWPVRYAPSPDARCTSGAWRSRPAQPRHGPAGHRTHPPGREVVGRGAELLIRVRPAPPAGGAPHPGGSGGPIVVRILLVRQYVTTLARSGRLRTTEPPRAAASRGHPVDDARMRVDPVPTPSSSWATPASGSPVPDSSARPGACARSPGQTFSSEYFPGKPLVASVRIRLSAPRAFSGFFRYARSNWASIAKVLDLTSSYSPSRPYTFRTLLSQVLVSPAPGSMP